MLRIRALFFILCLFCFASITNAAQRTRKVVFLAGAKSHGFGAHEYEQALRLLAHCLETSPNVHGIKTEVHLYGWPENPKTLEDADCIVLYSDGSDHNEQDHPLLIGDRLETIGRQMKRGCGLVLLHYATFAPVKRGGPEYLEWVGGHFDYETGKAANHWASNIQSCNSNPYPPVANHPITRGVKPFNLTEEYYYRIKFRDNDPRLVPILNVTIPNEPQDQTVAWAVSRADGGRGFATTCGHPYTNYLDANFRRVLLNGIVWSAHVEVPKGGVQSTVVPAFNRIPALILTGKHHPAHDWRATTEVLKAILAKDPRFDITVWEDPEKLAGEDLSKYKVIIQNYNNWESPSLSLPARKKLLDFVQTGGGLLLLHFANGAWRDWPQYYGKMSRRIWVDGKSNHDAYGPFRVQVKDSQNILTRGLTDFDTVDELYCSQQGDLPVTPLLTAVSKVTGKEEPLAFAYREGLGSVFQTLLGHDAGAVANPTHAEIIRRAAEWLARREVVPQALSKPVSVVAQPVRAAVSHGEIGLAEGKFGKALDARIRAVAGGGRAQFQDAPITVECWARLFSNNQFNILVANSEKESPRHWELYTEAGTGKISAYLPGASPTNTVGRENVCDGKWHYFAMVYQPERLRLYVDGKLAADQKIGVTHVAPRMGPLWIGAYPPQGIPCDGLIDDVRVSTFAREITESPTQPFAADKGTVALYRFDQVDMGHITDVSGEKNVAFGVGSAQSTVTSAVEKLILPETGIPTIDPKTSLDWTVVGNDPGGMRFSKLTHINKSNVSRLKPVWTFASGESVGGGSTIECAPIVINGVMYVTTPKLKIVALDAATGKVIWSFDTHSGGVNRGVTYWSDGKPGGKRRIVMGTPDGRLFSLDAATGIPDPAFGNGGVVNLKDGIKERDIRSLNYGVTSAVAMFEHRIFIPIINTEGQPGAPGDVRAFDVRDGKELWRFRTVPEPGEFGNETWTNGGWTERSGTNPWSGFTVDAQRGILFCGTGSASSDFYGGDRLGNNLFANCTLALDARTGKRIWHFQTVHHDLWDHDTPCPPVMVTVKRGGKTIDAVAQLTKTGICFVFDRVTGKPLFEVKEVPATSSDIPGEQASPTQPVPVKPAPFSRQFFTLDEVTDISPEARASVLEQLKTLRYGKLREPPSLEGTVVAPGFHGGANWSGGAFDPTTGVLYFNSNNVPYICKLKANGSGGYDFMGYTYFNDHEGNPAMKPPWGLLNALNVSTGEYLWQVPLGELPQLKARGIKPTGSETFGGAIVTAGGLVFIGGSKDEKFHAYDKATGKLLWEKELPAGAYSNPCTYMVNGKQYVVVAAGGGGKLRTKSGDKFIAFAVE